MSEFDPAEVGTAIAAALAAQQQAAADAAAEERQQRLNAAAAGFVGTLMPGVTLAPVAAVNPIVEEAKTFIANAEANPDVEFDAGHLKMFLEIKFPGASAADIEAAIVAAEGS